MAQCDAPRLHAWRVQYRRTCPLAGCARVAMKTCCRILTPVAAVHEMKDPSSFLCQRPGVHASGGREIHSKSSSVTHPDMAVAPLHIVTELVWLAASSIEHEAVLPSSSSVGSSNFQNRLAPSPPVGGSTVALSDAVQVQRFKRACGLRCAARQGGLCLCSLTRAAMGSRS